MSQTALTVGTEYTERMMSGTGTESDPWIIGGGDDERNLQNFFDAIYTDSAYIKMAKDIDASKSITYRESVPHYIHIKAKRTYADEKKKISGLCINADYALYGWDTAEHHVEKLQFLSMIHYGAKSTLQGYADGSGGVYFSNCDFSIKKHCNGNVAQCSDSAFNFDHCSIDYEPINYSDDSPCKIFSTSRTFNACSIRYKGPVFGYGYVSNAMLGNATRCAVTGEIMAMSSGTYLFENCGYCYFAGKITADKVNATVGTGLYSSNPQCIVCPTEIDGAYTVTINTNIKQLTVEQMKSRDYLLDTGFLP